MSGPLARQVSVYAAPFDLVRALERVLLLRKSHDLKKRPTQHASPGPAHVQRASAPFARHDRSCAGPYDSGESTRSWTGMYSVRFNIDERRDESCAQLPVGADRALAGP